MKWISFLFTLTFFIAPFLSWSQLTSKEILQRSEEKLRGESSTSTLKMSIIRPTWTREITMKNWTLGDDYALTLVTSPARDEGIVFLKRDDEIWNWQPTIERMIKLPPSMMMQSWMGSDFTNDDLVRQSSLVEDFNHEKLADEEVDGRICYTVELIPKEDAAVVWGKVIMWIDQEEFLQLKSEFYDEDDILVNTIYGKDIQTFGGKSLPSRLEVIPADEDGNKTIVEYLDLSFGVNLEASFFSIQNAKRIK